MRSHTAHFGTLHRFIEQYPHITLALSGFLGAILLLFLLWLTLFFGLPTGNAQARVLSFGSIFGVPIASAQAGVTYDSCAEYPIKGKTTAVTGDFGIANSGVFYFDPAVVPKSPTQKIYLPPETKRACAEKKSDGSGTIQLKGWAWNDNTGWMSLFCPGGGGNNMGVSCGDQKYGVTIDSSGEFHGYAWSNAGWIRFNCASTPEYKDASHCGSGGVSNYKVKVNPKALYGDGYVDVLAGSYALSSQMGWLNFAGTKIPLKADPIPPKEDEPPPEGVPPGDTGPAGGGTCTPENCPPYSCGAASDTDGDGSCKAPAAPPPFNDCKDDDYFVSPYYSESCGDGIDNNCNGQVDEEPFCAPKGAKKPVSDASSDYTYNIPYFTGNLTPLGDGLVSIGGAVRKDIRNTIFRNVQALKRSASTQCGVLGNILSFPIDDDIFYCHGDVTIGPVASWKGPKTLIVEDGNVFIRGDIYSDDPDSQFGLIVVRSNLKDSTKANVYLSGDVRQLRVQMYADGSMFPAVEDPASGGFLGGPKKPKKMTGGLPDVQNSDYSVESGSFFGQLLLQGQFITRNTFGVKQYIQPVEGQKLPDSFGKLTVSDPNVGKFYSLGFMRAVPKKAGCDPTKGKFILGTNDCVEEWSEFLVQIDGGGDSEGEDNPSASKKSDKFQKKFVKKLQEMEISTTDLKRSGLAIFYEPPLENLPGFNNITQSNTVQKGF